MGGNVVRRSTGSRVSVWFNRGRGDILFFCISVVYSWLRFDSPRPFSHFAFGRPALLQQEKKMKLGDKLTGGRRPSAALEQSS